MADNALQWCSVDTFKSHLEYARDADGNFSYNELDTKIVDCIEGAVSWCSRYTGLPLIKRIRPYVFMANQLDYTQPLRCNGVVSFSGVNTIWNFPDAEGLVNPERITPFHWQYIGDPTYSVLDWLIYAPVRNRERIWPATTGRYVVEVIEDVKVSPNQQFGSDPGSDSPLGTHIDRSAIVNAVILTARDIFESGYIKEKKTPAEFLLKPFKIRLGI